MVWQRRIGGTGNDRSFSLCFDSKDNLVVGGLFFESADFSPSVKRIGNGRNDAAIAKYDPNGKLIFVTSFGGARDDGVEWVLCGANDVIVAGGYFQDSVDFGSGPIAARGWRDLFVMRLDGAGSIDLTRTFGSADVDAMPGGAMDSQGAIYAVGWSYQPLDVGSRRIQGPGWLIRFAKP